MAALNTGADTAASDAADKASSNWVEETIASTGPKGGDKEPPRDTAVVEAYRAYGPGRAAAVEARLVRRIDLRILPVLVLIYICNYLDRNSITQARLYGIQDDTGVHGALWNTAISVFSAGYILMQLPTPLILTKVRPSVFLPTVMALWAVVSGCTGAANSPGSLLAIRVLLGLVEAPFFPGAIYFLSCWYTRREIGVRMALLVSGIVLSNAFAGLLSAGILRGMDGAATRLPSWRWLFIIEGLMTLAVAALARLSLPDYPGTTRWLTEEERVVAQARLIRDAGAEDAYDGGGGNGVEAAEQRGRAEDMSTRRGLVAALRDYRVWIFGCMQMATTAGISYSHFFPTLVKDLGFADNIVALLLTSPPYVFAFAWSISLSWHADRTQRRSPYAGASMLTAICATVLLIAVPERLRWARYAFTFPLTAGMFGVYATTYAWLSSTIVLPRPKRAAAIGAANLLANVASLYGNYFWLDRYAPSYRVSWAVLLAFQCLGLGCILALRCVTTRDNRHLDRLCASTDVGTDEGAARLADMTPVERNAVLGGFRYIT